jgi:hypothetical protein
LSFEP